MMASVKKDWASGEESSGSVGMMCGLPPDSIVGSGNPSSPCLFGVDYLND